MRCGAVFRLPFLLTPSEGVGFSRISLLLWKEWNSCSMPTVARVCVLLKGTICSFKKVPIKAAFHRHLLAFAAVRPRPYAFRRPCFFTVSTTASNSGKCCHCGEGFGKGLSQPIKAGEAGVLLCGFSSDAMPGRWDVVSGRWDMMPRRYLRDDILPQNGCTSIFGQNQNSLLFLPFLNELTRIWQKRKRKRRIPR